MRVQCIRFKTELEFQNEIQALKNFSCFAKMTFLFKDYSIEIAFTGQLSAAS